MTDGRTILRQRLDDLVVKLRAIPDRAAGFRARGVAALDSDAVYPLGLDLDDTPPHTSRELSALMAALRDDEVHVSIVSVGSALSGMSDADISEHCDHLVRVVTDYAERLIADTKIRAAVLARDEVWRAMPLGIDFPGPAERVLPAPNGVEMFRRTGRMDWVNAFWRAFGPISQDNPFNPDRVAISDVRAWQERAGIDQNVWLCAVLYLAERNVLGGLAAPMMYADAGPTHRRTIGAIRRIDPSDRPGHLATWRHPTRPERRLLGYHDPTDSHYQLTLFGGAAPPAAVVALIRRVAKGAGLRAYAALHVMAANQGRPTDAFVVTPESYLAALGVSADDTRARARWLATLRGLLHLRLERVETTGTRTRTGTIRILTIWTEFNDKGPAIDNDDASGRFIAGKLQFHPDLYGGVRTPSGAIGTRFGVFPAELATLHETACMLGWELFFYLSGEIRHGRHTARLRAETLFGYAGIKYVERRRAACFDQLDAALGEMVRVGYLQSVEWDDDGPARNTGTCATLAVDDRVLDRMARGLHPPGDYMVSIPTNGDELREWREKQGQTQAEAADALGVNRRTLIRAEADGPKPLTATLRKAIGTGR